MSEIVFRQWIVLFSHCHLTYKLIRNKAALLVLRWQIDSLDMKSKESFLHSTFDKKTISKGCVVFLPETTMKQSSAKEVTDLVKMEWICCLLKYLDSILSIINGRC